MKTLEDLLTVKKYIVKYSRKNMKHTTETEDLPSPITIREGELLLLTKQEADKRYSLTLTSELLNLLPILDNENLLITDSISGEGHVGYDTLKFYVKDEIDYKNLFNKKDFFERHISKKHLVQYPEVDYHGYTPSKLAMPFVASSLTIQPYGDIKPAFKEFVSNESNITLDKLALYDCTSLFPTMKETGQASMLRASSYYFRNCAIDSVEALKPWLDGQVWHGTGQMTSLVIINDFNQPVLFSFHTSDGKTISLGEVSAVFMDGEDSYTAFVRQVEARYAHAADLLSSLTKDYNVQDPRSLMQTLQGIQADIPNQQHEVLTINEVSSKEYKAFIKSLGALGEEYSGIRSSERIAYEDKMAIAAHSDTPIKIEYNPKPLQFDFMDADKAKNYKAYQDMVAISNSGKNALDTVLDHVKRAVASHRLDAAYGSQVEEMINKIKPQLWYGATEKEYANIQEYLQHFPVKSPGQAEAHTDEETKKIRSWTFAGTLPQAKEDSTLAPVEGEATTLHTSGSFSTLKTLLKKALAVLKDSEFTKVKGYLKLFKETFPKTTLEQLFSELKAEEITALQEVITEYRVFVKALEGAVSSSKSADKKLQNQLAAAKELKGMMDSIADRIKNKSPEEVSSAEAPLKTNTSEVDSSSSKAPPSPAWEKPKAPMVRQRNRSWITEE